MVGLFLSFGLIFKMAIDLLTNIVFLTPAWMEFTISAFSIIYPDRRVSLPITTR